MIILNELIETLSKRKSFILELIKLENTIKKRNTYNIGYLWNIIFNLATIFVLSVIFNKGFFKEGNYLFYLVLNFFLWGFISNTLSNSCDIYRSNNNFLLNNDINFFIFNIKNIIIFFKVFVLSLPIVLIFIITENVSLINILLTLTALVLIFINVFFVSISISILSLKIKDFDNYTNLILLLTFYFTPIIWSEAILGKTGSAIIKINPLYYFFKIYNFPMLNSEISLKYFVYFILCIIFTIINFIIASIITKKFIYNLKNYL